jgi:phosphoserine phosphatase RsbU/P
MQPGETTLPPSSAWKQLLDLGEQLVRSAVTSAQCELVEETTSHLLNGEARLWLSQPGYPLPGEPEVEVLPAAPASDLVQRARLSLTPLCERPDGQIFALSPDCPAVSAAAPLHGHESLLGVLEIRRSNSQPLTEQDLALFESLAQTAGMALEISRQEKLKNWRYGQLALVRDVSAQIASVLDVDELCRRVTSLIQQTFHYSFVAIFSLEADNSQNSSLLFRAAAHHAQAEPILQGFRIRLGEGIVGSAGLTGEQIVAPDVLIEPRYRLYSGLEETLSEACFPMKVEEEILGVLDVQSDQIDEFHEIDVLVLASLADNIAVALKNARLYSDLQIRAGQISSVFEISHALNSILDYEILLDEIVDLIQKRFAFPHVHIFSVHPGRRLIIYQAGSGERSRAMRDQMISYALDAPLGLIPEVARSGLPRLANDVSLEPLYVPPPMPPYNTHAELVIPLKLGEEVIGILDIHGAQTNAFSENDRSLFEALASTIAIAFRNASLYRSEKWRRQVAESFRDTAYQITSSADLDSMLDNILVRLESNLPCDAAAIWLVEEDADPEGGAQLPLQLAAVRGARADELKKFVENSPWIFETFNNLLATPEPTIRDPSDPPGPLGHALNFETEYSSIIAPLHAGSQPLGLLTLVHHSPGRYGSEAQSMTATFASYAAAAIQNTRLYTEAQQQAWVSTMLLQVAEASQTTLSLDDLLATMLRLTRLLVGVRKCAFLLRDESAPYFELKAWYGFDLLEGSRIRLPETTPALVRLDAVRAPLFLSGAAEDLGMTEMTLPHQSGTLVMLPLLVRSELNGVFLVSLQTARFHADGKDFDPKTIAILQGIAHQTSMTVENLRLLEARQEEAHVTAALLQVAQAVDSANDLTVVLEQIVQLLPVLVGVDTCVVYLWDPAAKTFRPEGVYAENRKHAQVLQKRSYPSNQYELLSFVFHSAIIHLCRINDLDENPDNWTHIETRPLNTLAESTVLPSGAWLLGFPLTVQSQVLGVLVTRIPNAAPAFWERRMEIITGIAQQTSMAIQNDLLKHEMVQNERMEREIQLARQIQKTFLPDQLPQLEEWELDVRWETARQMGGDFYDVFELGDDRLGLVIADVSDKGLPAALYMTVTRTLIRSKIREHDNPAAVLKEVNELLYTESPESMFITVIYAILSKSSGAMIYANAGHNLPLIHRAETGVVDQLPKGGMALGVLPDIELRNHHIAIQPGDTLFLFTDGACDTLSPQGEDFGEPRLRDLMVGNCCNSAGELLETLDAALDEFRQDMPRVDDVTLIALRRSNLLNGS